MQSAAQRSRFSHGFANTLKLRNSLAVPICLIENGENQGSSAGNNTPTEAMACGCAVVSTDIGGVHDYAIDEKIALLSPVNDPEALTDNIGRLLSDDTLGIKIATATMNKFKTLLGLKQLWNLKK